MGGAEQTQGGVGVAGLDRGELRGEGGLVQGRLGCLGKRGITPKRSLQVLKGCCPEGAG